MKKSKMQTIRGNGRDQIQYLTWNNDKEKAVAFASLAKGLTNSDIGFTRGSNTYQDVLTNISIRDEFDRGDYENYRPGEAIPVKHQDIMNASNKAYYGVGLVRNVIDLMADFTCQGLQLVHPNPNVEKWWRAWWNRVDGNNVSERFTNYLYRFANVPVRRQTAKLTSTQVENIQKTYGYEIELDPVLDVRKNEIPLEYSIIDPMNVEVLNRSESIYTGNYKYGVCISTSLASSISSKKVQLPEGARTINDGGKRLIVFPDGKLEVYHYKKDDWEPYARPFIYSIMSELIMLEKMKLADMSALDGAMSHIRVWLLGDIEHGLVPNDAAVARLADAMMNNVGGGVQDMIWGPDIKLIETKTDWNVLTKEHYQPVFDRIYAGLGIPPSLTGSVSSMGTTNNYISLKTLIERLNYGRMILKSFWMREIKAVQLALGLRFPAQLDFDHMTLTDEAQEKKLILDLLDRDLISAEAVLDRFDEIPELEKVRIRREYKQRENKKMPNKAGPYHKSQIEDDLKKIALQAGAVTPSQVGLELKEKKEGEKPAILMKPVPKPGGNLTKSKPKGTPGQGRPLNKKDSTKRKTKKFVPRSKANIGTLMWAKSAQKLIADHTHSLFLKMLNKSSLRELTTEEANNIEELKFLMLCHTEPLTVINEQYIENLIQSDLSIDNDIRQYYNQCLGEFVETFGKTPNYEELRNIQLMVYNTLEGIEDNLSGEDDG